MISASRTFLRDLAWSDAARGVTGEAWANAAKHYDDDQLAALMSLIAIINAYNRISVINRH